VSHIGSNVQRGLGEQPEREDSKDDTEQNTIVASEPVDLARRRYHIALHRLTFAPALVGRYLAWPDLLLAAPSGD
jgi:hypothetical protein